MLDQIESKEKFILSKEVENKKFTNEDKKGEVLSRKKSRKLGFLMMFKIF